MSISQELQNLIDESNKLLKESSDFKLKVVVGTSINPKNKKARELVTIHLFTLLKQLDMLTQEINKIIHDKPGSGRIKKEFIPLANLVAKILEELRIIPEAAKVFQFFKNVDWTTQTPSNDDKYKFWSNFNIPHEIDMLLQIINSKTSFDLKIEYKKEIVEGVLSLSENDSKSTDNNNNVNNNSSKTKTKPYDPLLNPEPESEFWKKKSEEYKRQLEKLNQEMNTLKIQNKNLQLEKKKYTEQQTQTINPTQEEDEDKDQRGELYFNMQEREESFRQMLKDISNGKIQKEDIDDKIKTIDEEYPSVIKSKIKMMEMEINKKKRKY